MHVRETPRPSKRWGTLYQAYLMNSGLDNTSPMASESWGKQIKMMVGEFGPALKEMGLLE